MIRDTSKKCVVVALKVRIKLASFLFLFQKCGTPNQGVMISTVYGKKVQPSSRTDSLVDIMPAFVFGPDVRRHVGEGPDALTPQPLLFDKDLRAVTGPHLRKARLKREECRRIKSDAHPFIASSVGFPYTALRDERRFLFDPHHSYPLHQILADTLGVDDLSQLHKYAIQDRRELLSPLLTTEGRLKFQEWYDTFVTSFCIPLLHSLAMTKQ